MNNDVKHNENEDLADNILPEDENHIPVDEDNYDDSDTCDTDEYSDDKSEEDEQESPIDSLVAANEEIDRLKDGIVRKQAEMDNLRKRQQKEISNAYRYSIENFAKEMLVVLDSIDMGVEACQDESADIKKISEGVELSRQAFIKSLEKFDIKIIKAQGELFNAELHQAITMTENKDFKSNTVLEVMQKGYQISDRLLRPAMVIVAK
ncbi:MAG: nucleotide exchange factor GrpE [Gammaproteobacteria bacterium]|nr:MAG: nucleotide exchange factor GrpE [Gammaproteobacteria bacterium]